MDELVTRYDQALLACNDPTAASILVLAYQISALEHQAAVANESLKDFGHQLCIGIRTGLFGADAPPTASIKDCN